MITKTKGFAARIEKRVKNMKNRFRKTKKTRFFSENTGFLLKKHLQIDGKNFNGKMQGFFKSEMLKFEALWLRKMGQKQVF